MLVIWLLSVPTAVIIQVVSRVFVTSSFVWYLCVGLCVKCETIHFRFFVWIARLVTGDILGSSFSFGAINRFVSGCVFVYSASSNLSC